MARLTFLLGFAFVFSIVVAHEEYCRFIPRTPNPAAFGRRNITLTELEIQQRKKRALIYAINMRHPWLVQELIDPRIEDEGYGTNSQGRALRFEDLYFLVFEEHLPGHTELGVRARELMGMPQRNQVFTLY